MLEPSCLVKIKMFLHFKTNCKIKYRRGYSYYFSYLWFSLTQHSWYWKGRSNWNSNGIIINFEVDRFLGSITCTCTYIVFNLIFTCETLAPIKVKRIVRYYKNYLSMNTNTYLPMIKVFSSVAQKYYTRIPSLWKELMGVISSRNS